MKTVAHKTSVPAEKKPSATRPFFPQREEQPSSFFADADRSETAEFFLSPAVQTKLTVGRPDDKYEREADDVADRVVARQSSGKGERVHNMFPVISPQLQLRDKARPEQLNRLIQAQAENEEEEELQTTLQLQTEPEEEGLQAKIQCHEGPDREVLPAKAKAQLTGVQGLVERRIEHQLQSSKGQGSPLSRSARGQMETAFGVNFGTVRIHTTNTAIQMSKDLGALAFTHGSDIYFNEGQFQPDTLRGKHLLAHELAHTIHQGAVRNSNSPVHRGEDQPHLKKSGKVAGPFDKTTATGVSTIRKDDELVQGAQRDEKRIHRRPLPGFAGTVLGRIEVQLPVPEAPSLQNEIVAGPELVLSQEGPGRFTGFEDQTTADLLAHQYPGRIVAVVRDTENRYHAFLTDQSSVDPTSTFTVLPAEASTLYRSVRFSNVERNLTSLSPDEWRRQVHHARALALGGSLMEAAALFANVLAATVNYPRDLIHLMQHSEDRRPGVNFNVHLRGPSGQGGILRLPETRRGPIPEPFIVITRDAFAEDTAAALRATFLHELTHFAHAQRSIELLRQWRNEDTPLDFQQWLTRRGTGDEEREVEARLAIGLVNRDDHITETLAHLNAFMSIYHQTPLDRPAEALFGRLFIAAGFWASSRPIHSRTLDRLIAYYDSLDLPYQDRMRQYVASRVDSDPPHQHFFRALHSRLNS